MNTDLHVVTAVFNPWRYKSRVRLYNDFAKYVADSGAILHTIELAMGDRDFTVTDENNPNHIQVRTSVELWHKERMLNIAIQRLPRDWNYCAWIDADVVFARPDWVQETVHLLQHYPVIQMFSEAADLSPDYEILKVFKGLAASYVKGDMPTTSGKYEAYHPGFAWAMRKDCYNNLGGLYDHSILGSADRFMGMSFINKGKLSYPGTLSTGYKESLELWNDRAVRYVNCNLGYMSGLLLHNWHGKKVNRRYKDRWQILVKHGYDPEFDLKFDFQGLYQWTTRNPFLAYDVRDYFRARNEDSIDV